MKLIDKSALVTEIERRIKEISKECEESKTIQFTLIGKINALENLLPFLDTLEVKEINSTDAFIEKTENFLEMLGCGFTITDNITHTNYGKEQLIEDFRKYMEG